MTYNPQWKEYRAYFENTAVERLRQIGAPASWYWIVAQYDAKNFDYQALEQLRKVPTNQYDSLTLDELLSCQAGYNLQSV